MWYTKFFSFYYNFQPLYKTITEKKKIQVQPVNLPEVKMGEWFTFQLKHVLYLILR